MSTGVHASQKAHGSALWFSTWEGGLYAGELDNVFGHFWWPQLECTAIDMQLVEVKDAAEHPSIHRTEPHHKELPGPQCQQCWGWDTLATEQVASGLN